MNKDNKKYCNQCGKLLSKKNKNGLCKKHWDEYRKYGFCISDSPITEFDNNEIIIHKDYAEIVLYDALFQEELEERVLIDLDDVKTCKNVRWNKKHSCIIGDVLGKNTTLQNYILGNDNKIEFINGDFLDCRKENLNVIKKKKKKKKNPYIISKKNKNKVTVEFVGESHNGVVGTSILLSYPTKEGDYEKVLIECGMVQMNGALREEYVVNKGVVEKVCECGQIKACFVSHSHL